MEIENITPNRTTSLRIDSASDFLVEARNISVRFDLMREKVESLKEYAVRSLKNQLYYDEFWALSDISFTLSRGESLGVIGPNGAGKSTLMRLLAGVLSPTLGILKVAGTTAPLITLGNGFDYELTGNENIYLNGAALGYSNEFMRERREEILDFAELNDFADVPIKNYSSGMLMRLGFSIATMVQPDILIADELLMVGDENFHAKCTDRIQRMMAKGMSAVIVSHSLEQIKKMCGKALLLDKGRMAGYGRVVG